MSNFNKGCGNAYLGVDYRVYIIQKKYNKICFGKILSVNPYSNAVTIQLDSGKVFKTNIKGFEKTFFLDYETAQNKLNEYNNMACE